MSDIYCSINGTLVLNLPPNKYEEYQDDMCALAETYIYFLRGRISPDLLDNIAGFLE
jgi:hypothetical protein